MTFYQTVSTQLAEVNQVVGIETKPIMLNAQVVENYLGTPELITLEKPGYPIDVNWAMVPGVQSAEISSGSLTIGPAGIDRIVETEFSNSNNKHFIIEFNTPISVSKVILHNMRYESNPEEFSPIPNSSTIQGLSYRLVLSVADSAGSFTPFYSVPSVPAREMLPSSLLGGSYEMYTLTMTPVITTGIRLSLVVGDFPEDFVPQTFFVDDITVYGQFGSKDCAIVDHDGEPLWSFPGELPLQTPPSEVKFAIQLQTALNEKIEKDEKLSVSFHIEGSDNTKAKLWSKPIQGFLLHTFSGITTTTLSGEQTLIENMKELPDEQPHSVIGGLTIAYGGIRLCENLMDSIPSTIGGINGTILATDPIIRVVPSFVLDSKPLARVAIVGRAPVDCSLALTIVELKNGQPGQPFHQELSVQITASEKYTFIWFDIEEFDHTGSEIAISLRCIEGRFFWVEEDDYLVRVAVYDDDPPQTPVSVNGIALTSVGKDTVHIPAFDFPTGPFKNGGPYVESLLFCTVDFSDLIVRYVR